jgi:hydrogenase maturation protein HypF
VNGKTRKKFRLIGRVQGVGFRPFVYNLAVKHELAGYVLNSAQGVIVEVEGPGGRIALFRKSLLSEYPPIATVEKNTEEEMSPTGETEFKIRFSDDSGERIVLPVADISICNDCLREIKSPENRRFGYPFTSCTYCGPRFTVADDIPYDRERTTMNEFAMCPECGREYRDPADRRFHSQLNACAACGPEVVLLDSEGRETAHGEAAVSTAAAAINDGNVAAVKGLGGYHLACDAENEIAVRKLREKKARGEKPLAIMVPDIEAAENICFISPEEKKIIAGPRHPIVLLRKRCETPITERIAPGCDVIGIMLPYTPLHHLLLAKTGRYIVMTSGNMSDEPIVYEDGKVHSILGGIADCFLSNNRRIRTRCDDSVVRVRDGRELLIRRSRGYSPEPITTQRSFSSRILACGAELKNTFCMTRDEYVFTSHHIGDLETLEAMSSFEEGIEHFRRMLHWSPDAVAYDMHPEYLSTKYALALAGVEKRVAVQHHHAHIASCLADARENGPAIGVSMDGLGYGLDGAMWGGEILIADAGGFLRAAHLKPVPLPGGAAAIKQPWRMAAVYIREAFGDDFLKLDLPFVREIDPADWEILRHMIDRSVNAPPTTSMGRLFDAVSALIVLRKCASYEGQAAVELESRAGAGTWEGRPFEYKITEQREVQEFGITGRLPAIKNSFIIDPAPLIKNIVEELIKGTAVPAVSARFHFSIAKMIEEVCIMVSESCGGLKEVALSGGVFQNIRLLDETVPLLAKAGFRVLTHSRVPPNDGGLALGQAVIADELLKQRYGE